MCQGAIDNSESFKSKGNVGGGGAVMEQTVITVICLGYLRLLQLTSVSFLVIPDEINASQL